MRIHARRSLRILCPLVVTLSISRTRRRAPPTHLSRVLYLATTSGARRFHISACIGLVDFSDFCHRPRAAGWARRKQSLQIWNKRNGSTTEPGSYSSTCRYFTDFRDETTFFSSIYRFLWERLDQQRKGKNKINLLLPSIFDTEVVLNF